VLRAVGNNHSSAHALGYPVLRIRMLAVLFGGACAGLGGAFLPLAYTPFFIPGRTAGRGWIARALVVFASWLLAGLSSVPICSARYQSCNPTRRAPASGFHPSSCRRCLISQRSSSLF
jgi:ABC-type uncharacterized transport system permease subunit